jgi:hypothetical protein
MAAAAHTDGDSESSGGGGRYRLLVLAGEAVAGPELRRQITDRVGDRPADVHVVSPALTDSRFEHAMGDVDDARAAAEERLETSLGEIRRTGAEVTGEVGESDPTLAIEDALQTFPADEILIATHPDDEARWLEDEAFERARERFEPPITHVVVERDRSGAEHVAEVERAPRGVEGESDREAIGRSRNLPPLSARDLGGIFVAVVGMIVLVVLAATCPGELEEGGGSDTACVIRAVIAGALGLINIAHIVGLVLFQSVRYRGAFERFFALASLWGTPAAIIASILIH